MRGSAALVAVLAACAAPAARGAGGGARLGEGTGAPSAAPGAGDEDPVIELGELIADDGAPPPILLSPREPGAAAIGGPVPAAASASSVLADAVLALARRLHRAPVLDPRLSAAAALLAVSIPEGAPVSDGVIDFARQWAGISEPDPALIVVRGDPDAAADAAAAIRARLTDEMFRAPDVRIGVAAAPGAGPRAIAVLVLRSSAAIERAPRTAQVGDTFELAAILPERLRDPEVEVARTERSGGEVEGELVRGIRVVDHPGVDRGLRGRISSRIACTAAGRVDVELAATGALGRIALARFALWCGVPPPERYAAAPPGLDDGLAALEPAQRERRLIALVNRSRIAAGVEPLRLDRRTTEAARARAAALLAAHTARTDAPILDAAAIEPGTATSGAIGTTLAAAYEALANMPRSREAMLIPTATHVGAGLASSADAIVVSLMYLAVPPPLDIPRVRRELAGRLVEGTEIAIDPQLGEIAQRYARLLAAGGTSESVYREMKPRIDEAGRRFTRIEQAVVRTHAIHELRRRELIGNGDVEDLGVGVVQLNHASYGRRTLWVVVFRGKRLVPRALRTTR